jgi:hypothetical protein
MVIKSYFEVDVSHLRVFVMKLHPWKVIFVKTIKTIHKQYNTEESVDGKYYSITIIKSEFYTSQS